MSVTRRRALAASAASPAALAAPAILAAAPSDDATARATRDLMSGDARRFARAGRHPPL